MNTSAKDLTKIFLVVILLIILISGIVVLRIKKRIPEPPEKSQRSAVISVEPTVSIGANSMFLVVNPTAVQSGEFITAAIAFHAPGRMLSGADVRLKYDPLFLETSVSDLTPGEYFTSYPAKSVNTEKGIIRLTAFGGKRETVSSPQVITTVKFKALKPGRTEITIDYQQGSTNRSTLVERGTSKNILSGVSNAVVEIK